MLTYSPKFLNEFNLRSVKGLSPSWDGIVWSSYDIVLFNFFNSLVFPILESI